MYINIIYFSPYESNNSVCKNIPSALNTKSAKALPIKGITNEAFTSSPHESKLSINIEQTSVWTTAVEKPSIPADLNTELSHKYNQPHPIPVYSGSEYLAEQGINSYVVNSVFGDLVAHNCDEETWMVRL